ncbi:MAG: alpha/beta hydrolase [Candidatus Marinimicrobia bacterium]|nr:alpha/beta hydrolase [Candidatus Neomarinimicrobiota bacterium]
MKNQFPNDVPINRWGAPSQTPLFFLHANSYSAKMYQTFLQPLFSDYDIVAPDLPGHGESRWDGLIYAWQDLADEYIRLLEKSPPQAPMIGMGHSIGGIVIMLIALQRPDWFSKIILLDPVLLPKPILWVIRTLRFVSLSQIIPVARAAERRKSHFPTKQAALDHFGRKAVFANWETGMLETYIETCLKDDGEGTLTLSCSPRLESSIYQSIPAYVWELPAQLKAPTLFLIGEQSDTIDQRGVQQLQKLAGNHVVKRIAGGHLFPFENSVESMNLIKEFLAK